MSRSSASRVTDNSDDEHEKPIQKYDLHEHLGSGASGDAFRVVHKRTSHPYVLKKMSLANMTDEEQLRAKQEITVMYEVDHPNIVKFRESFSDPDDNTVGIIMEYCECGTLEDLIERQRYEGRPFETDVLLEWMAELLCGLAQIHSQRIMHRDLKTSNIFVTSKNHLKLGDFGVCTVLSNPGAKAESMIGTPLYFAPEVCENEAYDERSDVWSLGIVFYEMCTLQRPFEGENLFSLIRNIITANLEPFSNGVPGNIEGLVRLMLSKDPENRPTAKELIDDHLEVPPGHPSHPSVKPSRGRLLQQFTGPKLNYYKPWPPPGGKSTLVKKAPEAVLSTGEWINTGSALDLFVELQRTTHGIAALKKTVTATTECASNPQVVRTTTVPATKSSLATVDKGTKKKTPKSKDSSVLESKKVIRKVHPSDGARPVSTGPPATSKARKSPKTIPLGQSLVSNGSDAGSFSFTMLDLHQDIRKRRSEMFGDDSSVYLEDVPVVIELQSSTPDGWGSLRSSRSRGLQSTVEEATVKEPSSFFSDIAAVLDRHTAGGKQIDLDHLDDAASLLAQYKFLTYGSR